MRLFIFLSILSLQYVYAQTERLKSIISQIEELKVYDNGVVILHDSIGSLGWPNWDRKSNYIETDRVYFDGRTYEAIADNLGNEPNDSPEKWVPISNRHPYPFLRDSANLNDLIKLAESNHGFVRTYAFAALAHRKYDNVFQIVLKNLKDSVKIRGFSGDVGFEEYIGDIMLWYSAKGMTNQQKEVIRKLILTRYRHLKALEKILLYHKPNREEYTQIKAIAISGVSNPFGLVAVSGYQKHRDIKLLKNGFQRLEKVDPYYGYKFFFKAIENFPVKDFWDDLVKNKSQVKMNDFMWDRAEYFFNALASYQNNDCVELFDEIISQKRDGDSNEQLEVFYENQKIAYLALKKHYTPLYDQLLRKIEGLVQSDFNLNASETGDPWNY